MTLSSPQSLLFVALLLGCNSAPIRLPVDAGGGGSGGSGGSAGGSSGTGGGSADAGACECRVEGFVLTMSWACYCATFDCTLVKPACGPNRVSYPSCGLVTDTLNPPGGPYISVFDSSGKLVGQQITSDTSPFACPSDPSLTASRARAGRFPESTCSEAACTCIDGASSCPQPDAGSGDARDAATPSDASCSGPQLVCVAGSSGGQCSDAGQPSICVNGQRVCPGGTIPFSQCACSGAPPPGCTCGSAGWTCSGGGRG